MFNMLASIILLSLKMIYSVNAKLFIIKKIIPPLE